MGRLGFVSMAMVMVLATFAGCSSEDTTPGPTGGTGGSGATTSTGTAGSGATGGAAGATGGTGGGGTAGGGTAGGTCGFEPDPPGSGTCPAICTECDGDNVCVIECGASECNDRTKGHGEARDTFEKEAVGEEDQVEDLANSGDAPGKPLGQCS